MDANFVGHAVALPNLRHYNQAMEQNRLEQEVLHLSVEDRARLAVRLLESLDDTRELDAERLWAQEARHRAEQIDHGEVELVSDNELKKRIKAILK